MKYNIDEHQHRFAAWAAGRVASVKGCRFTVEQAAQILDQVDFNLPSPDEFDAQHRDWRSKVIENL
jgi:hypothetical protein